MQRGFSANIARCAGTAAMLLAAVPATAAQTDDTEIQALRAEVKELRDLVRSMQAQIENDKHQDGSRNTVEDMPSPARTAETPAQPLSLPTQKVEREIAASPLPQRRTVGDRITGASRFDNLAPPNDPELKGFIAIPGTETMVRIGGYAKVDTIWDPAHVGDPNQFAVPSTSFGLAGRHRATVNARATRFSLEIRRPSMLGDLRFYVENDFYGDGSGYGFNLHHAYGQVGNIYGGFGYSALVDADALPDTLDDWGPGGAIFLRTASVRKAFKIAHATHLTLSIEQPKSDLGLIGDQSGASSVPDIVLVGRYESPVGHVQLGGVVRRIGYRDEQGRGDDVTAFGLSASGSRTVFERDLIAIAFNYGHGAARYVNDLNGLGLDAAIDVNGRLKLIEHIGGYGAYTHYWADNVRSNLVLGALRISDNGALDPTALRETRYGAFNIIWAPTSSFSVGLEGLYGTLERQDGRSRDSSRIQATIKYDFVH